MHFFCPSWANQCKGGHDKDDVRAKVSGFASTYAVGQNAAYASKSNYEDKKWLGELFVGWWNEASFFTPSHIM